MKIGSVIRSFVTETIPPKVKMFVVVGDADNKLACLFINTDLRMQSFPAELQGLQLPISPRACPFLNHDSLIDCSALFEKSKTKVNEVIQKDPGRLIGQIPNSILEDIMRILRKARSIEPALKKKFGFGY